MNSGGEKPLVLAVDDDADTLRLLERFLVGGGYNAMCAYSGEAALRLCQHTRPDLVLMDVSMPKMDGYQVCDALQRNPNTAYIPVVFVTGMDEEQDRTRAFAVGAVDYLVKPVSKDSLLKVVRTHLQTKSRFYSVQVATDLWDEAPLPQKFAEFREHMAGRYNVGMAAVQQLARTKAAEVYAFTEVLNLDETDLAQAMAEFFGLQYVDRVDPQAIQLGVLPTAFSRAHHAVAIRDASGVDVCVIANPFIWDLEALDILNRAFAGRPYRLVITDRKNITSLFFEKPAEPGAEAGVEVVEERSLSMEELLDTSKQATAVEIVDALLADAVRRGASDLHIEPERSRVRIRYRIDGLMHSVMPLPAAQLPSVVARIKIMSGMDISESRIPQDGGCMIRTLGRQVELRASTLPGTNGEIVVLRILGQSHGLQSLEAVGFEQDMLRQYRRILATRQGMILITGPTGSGKTNTLYASLAHLNREDLNILTVEDPVEMDLEGINQVQVHERAGRTFAATLRSMLRQDPDIIMVGEIRDVETAEIACRGALTGHLVLSTVHTQNTLGTLVRLFDMGVAPYLAASALNGVLAQRLVKRVCEDCAVAYEPPPALRRALEARFGDLAGARFRRGEGCGRCLRTGSRGRIGVFELLVIDDDLRHLMTEGAAPSALREYVERRGWRSLEDDAFRKAYRGIIAPEEIVGLGFSLAAELETEPGG